jgi:hypothetical protein
MRTYKWSIIISTLVCIFSFGISLVCNFGFQGANYWANLMLGIFTSSFLIVITAIIGYRVERKKTLEKFCTEILRILKIYCKLDSDDSLDVAMDNYIEVSKIDVFYLDTTMSEIDFLFDIGTFGHKKRTQIFEIYNYIRELQNLVVEKTFHFCLYKKTMIKTGNGNTMEMQSFIDELNAYFFVSTTTYIDGTQTTETKNKVNKRIREYLDQLRKITYRKVN